MDTWNDVYPNIAEETQVCRYDRLGVGYSDTVPNQTPRTSLEQSVDLHQVLEIAEIKPPYVLVGHSIAGYMLVSFTHLYPDNVVGVVFVDASIPENIQGAIPNATVHGAERLDVPASYRALREAEAGDMGDIPVVVLTSMHRFDEYQTQHWIREQAQWHASHSPNTQHILAEESGHYIQNDEPDLVIDSIFWVLKLSRNLQTNKYVKISTQL